jgi:hypothetical protein
LNHACLIGSNNPVRLLYDWAVMEIE